jgi:hypothetical protein
MKKILEGAVCAIVLVFSTPAMADPPIWDTDFGTNTGLQADDDSISMALGFDFPFLGITYNSIAINSNGGVALGNNDVYAGDDYLDYDLWENTEFEPEFSNVGNPMIAVFTTDLDNGDGPQGDLFFKSDGASATITWSDFATHDVDTEAFLTFQLRLDLDGTIVMGYQSFQADPATNLDDGIVVGVTDGSGATPPGSLDLSTESNGSSSNPSDYEIWCFDGSVAACFEPTQSVHTAFDLEQRNVVFEPDGAGGFRITNGSGDGDGGDGGGGALALWALGILYGLTGLAGWRRTRRQA